MAEGGKGKGKKIGRAKKKPSHNFYTSTHQREMNKIKRVLQSNGLKTAQAYGEKHNLTQYLGRIVANKSKATAVES
jgi:hypothetical protein